MASDEGADKKVNGNVIRLPSTNHALLRKIKHAEWLGQFAMSLGTTPPGREPVPLTPFRTGAINRLNYAAEYIRLLEKELFWLARDNRGLRRQVQHLGGTVPPPFQPEAEAAHLKEGAEDGSSSDDRSDDGRGDDPQGGSGR
jgi:hypothetical protein